MSSEIYQAEAEAVAPHPKHPLSRPQQDQPQSESHDPELKNDGIPPQTDQLASHLSPNAALTTPTTPTITSPEMATASTPLTALTSATTSPPSASRQRASTSGPIELDTALSHPGSVRINVKGAFIVEHGSASPPQTPSGSSSRGGSPSRQESKDIRLPNHTSVVSHIAVDVRSIFCNCLLEIQLAVLLTSHISDRSVVLWLNSSTSPANLTPQNQVDASTSLASKPTTSMIASSS